MQTHSLMLSFVFLCSIGECANRWEWNIEDDIKNASAYQAVSGIIEMEENPLFTRTVAVQRLYDFMRSSTKQLYAAEYAADPDYQHIECVTTSPGNPRDRLPAYTEAVRQFMSNTERPTIYHQDVIKSFAKKVMLNESIQKGLPVWEGQSGVVAIRDIADNTCIGHYYGDEYLEPEFDALFMDWAFTTGHPFEKKYDYALLKRYPGIYYIDGKEHEYPTVSWDAYHDYPGGQQQKAVIEAFINEPRSDLSGGRMTEEDRARQNTEFVGCTVDGVLLAFLVSNKEIRAGEQLFITYGSQYVRDP